MRFFVFAVVLGAVAWATPVLAAGPASDITADQLLELKLAQGEALESMDAEIETTIDSPSADPSQAAGTSPSAGSGQASVSVTTRARIAFDKVAGTTHAQKLDADGNVNVDIKTEGTDVSFKRGDGTWVLVPLDAQTRATLIEQGIELPDDYNTSTTTKQAGLAGHGRLPKDAAAKRTAKKQRIQKHLQRMKALGRFERRKEMDQDTPTGVMTGVDLDTPLGFEAEGLLNAPGKRVRTGKSRALFQSMGAVDAKTGQRKQAQGFDATLELVDEDSGVPVETSQFMRADRVKGMIDLDGTGGEIQAPSMQAADAQAKTGKHPFGHKKIKLPGWARKMKDADGVDVVEMQRTKVLKMRRVGGSVVPEETEQVDLTAAGEVRQRVKWKPF
jgi:hypothetical protein